MNTKVFVPFVVVVVVVVFVVLLVLVRPPPHPPPRSPAVWSLRSVLSYALDEPTGNLNQQTLNKRTLNINRNRSKRGGVRLDKMFRTSNISCPCTLTVTQSYVIKHASKEHIIMPTWKDEYDEREIHLSHQIPRFGLSSLDPNIKVWLHSRISITRNVIIFTSTSSSFQPLFVIPTALCHSNRKQSISCCLCGLHIAACQDPANTPC